MAQVIIRNLDPKVVEALRARAKANGRSLEAELRLVLLSEASAPTPMAREPAARYVPSPPSKKKPSPRTATTLKKARLRPYEPIKINGRSLSAQLLEDRRARD